MRLRELPMHCLTTETNPSFKEEKYVSQNAVNTLRETITMKMTNLQVNSTQP